MWWEPGRGKRPRSVACRLRPSTLRLRDGGRVVVDALKNRPDLAPECTQLCFTKFEAAYKDLGFPTEQSALDDLRSGYMNDDRVPVVLVCCSLDDPSRGRLLGTVTLEEDAMSTRPKLTPWVSDCLTLPEARGRGVATLLVRRLVALAGSLGQQRVYLWTEHEEVFFTKLGFRRLEPQRVQYAGATVTLMYIDACGLLAAASRSELLQSLTSARFHTERPSIVLVQKQNKT